MFRPSEVTTPKIAGEPTEPSFTQSLEHEVEDSIPTGTKRMPIAETGSPSMNSVTP